MGKHDDQRDYNRGYHDACSGKSDPDKITAGDIIAGIVSGGITAIPTSGSSDSYRDGYRDGKEDSKK